MDTDNIVNFPQILRTAEHLLDVFFLIYKCLVSLQHDSAQLINL